MSDVAGTVDSITDVPGTVDMLVWEITVLDTVS